VEGGPCQETCFGMLGIELQFTTFRNFQPQSPKIRCNDRIHWLVGHPATLTSIFEIELDKTIPSSTTTIAHLASIASQPKATNPLPNAAAQCFSGSRRRSIRRHTNQEPGARLDNCCRTELHISLRHRYTGWHSPVASCTNSAMVRTRR